MEIKQVDKLLILTGQQAARHFNCLLGSSSGAVHWLLAMNYNFTQSAEKVTC